MKKLKTFNTFLHSAIDLPSLSVISTFSFCHLDFLFLSSRPEGEISFLAGDFSSLRSFEMTAKGVVISTGGRDLLLIKMEISQSYLLRNDSGDLAGTPVGISELRGINYHSQPFHAKNRLQFK